MKRGWKIVLIIISLILVFILISRQASPREIDDVTPGIPCEKEYLEKADILWVIPKYNNNGISRNQTWCEEILALNKTLGMHGIQHYYKEFEENLTQEYLVEGIKEFEECFNQTPTIFKAPKLYISEGNKILVEKNNLEIRTQFHQVIRKVYHCSDSGTFPNWFHDLF